MQVRGEGGVGIGAGFDGVIVIVLGKHNPLASSELLFQMTSNDLLLHPSEGSGVLTHLCLVQGLACSSHDKDESLPLSVRGSSDGGDLLPIDGGEIGVAASTVSKMVMVRGGGGLRRALGLGQR
jgi:hypothetical protein